MAVDVVHILTRMRTPAHSVALSVEGRRDDQQPRRFVALRLHFSVGGTVPKHNVERAIALSRAKYCSVYHSMRRDLRLDTSFTVHEQRE